MAREMRKIIVFTNGKKMEIPDPTKVILAIRDGELQQHQASIDVNIPNIEHLKKTVRRSV